MKVDTERPNSREGYSMSSTEMPMLYPYFLHLVRYLFYVLCLFAAVFMFYAGFSPFRYTLTGMSTEKTAASEGSYK